MDKPNRYNKSDKKDFRKDNREERRSYRNDRSDDDTRDYKRRDSDHFKKDSRNSFRDGYKKDNDYRKDRSDEDNRDFKRKDHDKFRNDNRSNDRNGYKKEGNYFKSRREVSDEGYKKRTEDRFKRDNRGRDKDDYRKDNDSNYRKTDKDNYKKDFKNRDSEEKKDYFKNAWESDASLERKRKSQEPDEITFSKSLDDVEEQKFYSNRRYNKEDKQEERSKKVPRRDDFKNETEFKKKKKDFYESEDFKDRFTSFHKKNKVYESSNEGRRNVRQKFEGKDKYHQQDLENDRNPDAKMPLNKFLAHSGVCSRRDAVDVIKAGKVMVNGVIETSPGYKVERADQIKYNGKILKPSRDAIYVLLNKPKGYITTTEDPKGRKTVMDIFEGEIIDRIFPVGRLDRATTGLLLLTNDGELAQKLTHPKYEMRKVYQVKLDKAVTQEHYDSIKAGLTLEDGVAIVDKMTYLDTADEIGLEIHSGKNRIVRRIFESLGYVVEKLDRVMYAGLTKKNLPKGKWRLLTRQEIINLKHLGR